ncbi:DUF397 domain-containing protein [Streptomyces europaeiscabiei]|uniref:DUF397 domain-containing protein n=1 Tax=Streptomyces europaeiscabiei TaxID=146819 RepID=UPI0029BD269A|nr:DUF397 domain-containing protein [Streptomyces europaeiscabiei]MDX2760733.1 DUF397 domain-containing protein [Streptomyces europaeiscabiei]
MRPFDLTVATWRKSSYSNPDGGACVEVSEDFVAFVPVRDSKNPLGPVLMFRAGGWSSFVSAIRDRQLSD